MAKKKVEVVVVVAGTYPEKGTVADQKALKKLIKGMEDAQLVEWVELEGLSYKPHEHVSINRMRLAMAINELHFPSEPKAKKSASPYKDFSNEQLVAMAVEHNVPVEVTEDARIMRMRTIMSLRAHKVIV